MRSISAKRRHGTHLPRAAPTQERSDPERVNTAALGQTPNPVQRILLPEIQRRLAWNGLRLWTFGGARFDFRDRTVTELRELLERAVTELDEL